MGTLQLYLPIKTSNPAAPSKCIKCFVHSMCEYYKGISTTTVGDNTNHLCHLLEIYKPMLGSHQAILTCWVSPLRVGSIESKIPEELKRRKQPRNICSMGNLRRVNECEYYIHVHCYNSNKKSRIWEFNDVNYMFEIEKR